MNEKQTTFHRRRLGSAGPEVTPLGLGCFGLSNAYGAADPAEAVATLHHALDLGCNFLDTADIYGAGHNEELVGEVIEARRAQVIVSTKFGFICNAAGQVTGRDASPLYVRKAAEASLKRLRIATIDLYTLHRVDPAVPIEDTVGAMADLVAGGKVRYLGLSEASTEQIRRAHAVHPITAVQSEYSLWNRDPERDVLPLCRELGIGFVAFAPLGRGLFSGSFTNLDIEQNDFRRSLPRFAPENFNTNLELVHRLDEIADRRRLTPSQLALSWILQQGHNVFAIPGTRRRKHLEENLAAMDVTWTPEEMQEVDHLFAPNLDFGRRYSAGSLFAPE